MAQHVASPLTAALAVFFVHKAWQFPMIVAATKGIFYRWAVRVTTVSAGFATAVWWVVPIYTPPVFVAAVRIVAW